MHFSTNSHFLKNVLIISSIIKEEWEVNINNGLLFGHRLLYRVMTNSESSDCCLKSERDCFDVTLDKPWSGQLLRLPATLPLPGWGLKNISINKLCLGSKEHHYTNTHLSPECATNSQWSVISLLKNISQSFLSSPSPVPNPSPRSKIQSPEERDWDWGWQYNPTCHHPTLTHQ